MGTKWAQTFFDIFMFDSKIKAYDKYQQFL